MNRIQNIKQDIKNAFKANKLRTLWVLFWMPLTLVVMFMFYICLVIVNLSTKEANQFIRECL